MTKLITPHQRNILEILLQNSVSPDKVASSLVVFGVEDHASAVHILLSMNLSVNIDGGEFLATMAEFSSARRNSEMQKDLGEIFSEFTSDSEKEVFVQDMVSFLALAPEERKVRSDKYVALTSDLVARVNAL